MLDDIRHYISERVKPVDFKSLLLEDGPDDAPPAEEPPPADDAPADDGGFDDSIEGEDLGGGEGDGGDLGGDDFGGGDEGGSFGGEDFGGSGSSGGEGEGGEDQKEENPSADKYKDREDDPDFSNSKMDGQSDGVAIYDMDGALQGLNDTITSDDVDLSEIDKAKTVIEVIANGKKLIDSDFDDLKNVQSFSDIIKRSLEKVDDTTRNYFSMKIKQALINMQNAKKIEVNKAEGGVEQVRDIADQF